MTDANLVNKCRSGFSPTTEAATLLAIGVPCPRRVEGMSEAMDGRGQAHRDVLVAVSSTRLGWGLSGSSGSPVGRNNVGLKPDLQERPCPGGSHGT